MARLGPWDPGRRVAVAVSGGADSLALAVLAQGWGDPVALIVDHGLRAAAAAEAEATRIALVARNLPARVIRLHGLAPGPALAARARTARYAALSSACKDAGLVDLLLGHHAGDQAETVLMRQGRGSGPAGMAGMAAVAEADGLRLLRPLLGFIPGSLRAVVAGAGLRPVEDPTNADLRTTRARLRRDIGEDRGFLLATAARSAAARAVAEAAVAAEMAARASLHPEGYALLSPGPVRPDTLAALLRSLSGRRFPVSGVAAMAAEPRPGTLGGVRLLPAGRLGPGWLLVREAAAAAPPVAAEPGAVWDGRYRVLAAPPASTLGALGADAGGLRRRSILPRAVLETLPAFRQNGALIAVPHLHGLADCLAGALCAAMLPVAGAPFAA